MKIRLLPRAFKLAHDAKSRSASGPESADVGSSRTMMSAPGKDDPRDLDQLLPAERELPERAR